MGVIVMMVVELVFLVIPSMAMDPRGQTISLIVLSEVFSPNPLGLRISNPFSRAQTRCSIRIRLPRYAKLLGGGL